jgi:NAD(P)H-nitrite reductase large subunit
MFLSVQTMLTCQSQIKVKSDSLPVRYIPDGLEFEDGSKLKADVIVFATGCRANMKYMVEDIFGADVAEQMGDFWTLDKKER